MAGDQKPCSKHETLEYKVKTLNEKVETMREQLEKMEVTMSTSDRSQAVMENELKNISQLLSRIEGSIKTYFEQSEKRVGALEGRIKAIEDRPLNFWDSVIIGVIVAGLSSAVTWFVTRGKG